MIHLFYKFRFNTECRLHNYIPIEIINEKGYEIDKKLVAFIDTDSYKAFCGIVLNNNGKTLVKIVSSIFELKEEDYLKISRITESGCLELNDEYVGLKFELVISNVIDYLEICQAIEFDSYLLRGQANHEWGLEPSIFRKGMDMTKEKSLYKDILQWNIEIFSSEDFLKNACNMQHYGIPTRLMDWTSNPIHALYFACVGASEENKDGGVLIVNIDEIYDIDSEECREINSFLKYRFNGEIVDGEQKLQKTLTQFSYNKKKYMFFKTKYFNDRIKNQQGYFSIYIDISEEEAQNVRKKILKDVLENILKYLKTHQTIIKKEDEDRIKIKILLEYNKYTNIHDIVRGICNTIKEVLTINRGVEDLQKHVYEEIRDSKFEEIKYKQHRMEDILIYQKHISICIPKGVKKEITTTLDNFGVNSRVIYPDLEGLSRYMKEKYQ